MALPVWAEDTCAATVEFNITTTAHRERVFPKDQQASVAEFRGRLSDYFSRGGNMFINLNYHNPTLATSVFTGFKDGREKIEVPAYKLILAIVGAPGVRKSLLSDLAHEVQHSLSNRAKVLELQAARGTLIRMLSCGPRAERLSSN